MNLRARKSPAPVRALVWLLLGMAFLPAYGSDGAQFYTVEAINDEEFAEYPPPPPSNEVVREFTVQSRLHEEVIDVSSTHLRNLSITLENNGPDLIRAPYLFGPRGYDFRSLERLAAAISSGGGLTAQEKFIRAHEWKGRHVYYVVGGSHDPYRDTHFSANPLRVLNQYGAAMCHQSTATLNGILRVIPPIGSIYGRMARVNAHRVGEAFWEGKWHAFDTTPGAGIIQWIYYDYDNETIAPTWKYLIAHPDLVTRIKPWTGFSIGGFLAGALGDTAHENQAYPHWDFNYDLRPDESITLYFDMRGRLDKTSARQDNSGIYRCYSDYGSAVFKYRPDFTGDIYKKHAVQEENLEQTSEGLVPRDPSKPSWIVFEMRSTWCFAGADIAAWFKSGGNVYIAVKEDPHDTQYSSTLSWQLLDPARAEYASSMEGKMVYWVKFKFEGPGSGLSAAEIASEVQMSPWSMPGLEHGRNKIRFEAAEMGRSQLTVKYVYDDRSPIHNYEPALENQGRHISLRIGGVLQQGSLLDRDDYKKGEFWERIRENPGDLVLVKLEIYKVSGADTGRLVRTLVNRNLNYGYYDFYWDGRDDGGRRLPEGMYGYKLTINGKIVHGERLYLFGEIWPRPNEIEGDSPPIMIVLASADPSTAKVGQEVNFQVTSGSALGSEWSYVWDFGDKSTALGPSATHSYQEPGTYTARVVIRSDDEIFEASVTVNVVEEPSGGDDPPDGGNPPGDDPGGDDPGGGQDPGGDAGGDGQDGGTPDEPPSDDPGTTPDPPSGGGDPPAVDPPADDGGASGGDSQGEDDYVAPGDELPGPRRLPMAVYAAAGRLWLGGLAGLKAPDLIKIAGTLPELPESWLPQGKAIRVKAGGIEAEFVLSAKGRARSQGGTLRLHLKRKAGRLVRTGVRFTLFLQGDLKAGWLEGAAAGGDGSAKLLPSVPVEFYLGDLIYATELDLDLKRGARNTAKITLR